MAETEYHGATIDIPNTHYTISFLGEFVDWDVRYFFERITTVRINLKPENKR